MGGANAAGTVFKLTPSGKETALYSFTADTINNGSGSANNDGLVFDKSGNLYGTTTWGGAFGYGTVFKLTKAGKATVLHSFRGGKDGGNPYTGLAIDGAGSLYGTTQFGGDLNLKCAFIGGAPRGCGVVFKITQ